MWQAYGVVYEHMVACTIKVDVRDSVKATICPVETVMLLIYGDAIWPRNTIMAMDDWSNILAIHPRSHDARICL